MKKILFSSLFVISQLAFAQQLINFESGQGFTGGNIDGQVNWTTTGTGTGLPNITNQVITTEDKVDGVNGLKITKETAFPGQTNPIVGAFLNNISPAVAYNNFTVSFDMKITDQSASASDYEFQTVGSNGTAGVYIIRLKFVSTGTIVAAQTTGTTSTFATTTGTWTPNTWFRIKIVGNATGLTYYKDNVQIYSGNFFSQFNFNEMRFVHDNFVGSAYIDRIAINNEGLLATKETVTDKVNSVSVYPNPTSDFISFKTNTKIIKTEVFDIAGKNVNAPLQNNQIDVRSLPSGQYLINIETSEGKFTEKFIKK